MRTMTIVMGLGLSLALGGLQTASAQSGDRKPKSEENGARRARNEVDGPGPSGLLLRGITLTDAQRTRIDAARAKLVPTMKAEREQMRRDQPNGQVRGDTVAMRQATERSRALRAKHLEQEITTLRGILTPEQRIKLDANAAELKLERAARAKGGRGQRPAA